MIFTDDILVFQSYDSTHTQRPDAQHHILTCWVLRERVLAGLLLLSAELGSPATLDIPHHHSPSSISFLWLQCDAFTQTQPADTRYI